MNTEQKTISKNEAKHLVRLYLVTVTDMIDRYEPRVDSGFKFRQSTLWDKETQRYMMVPTNPNHERMYHRFYVKGIKSIAPVVDLITELVTIEEAMTLDRIYINPSNSFSRETGEWKDFWLVSIMTIERRKE